ncbi:MAG: tryptophan halogenase family protein [Pseudomonadota bacterium]
MSEINSVCILGGGTAGWMTAAALAHKFQATDLSISLVESEQIGTIGVGEATLPHIRFFNQALGIDEATFMQATRATFKLGIEFCDWSEIGESYIHPFGDFGEPVNGIDFHHVWSELFRQGRVKSLDAFSYPVVAAEQGRFHHPETDLNSIGSTFGYAYQFDSTLYAKFLRDFAEARGIQRIEGRVDHVHHDEAVGTVERLQLESGQIIEADLFIDCSGFRGLLIEGALESGYQDWSRWLPCNRAVAVACESAGPPVPYTRATAREAGWQWRIPLQHRTGNGYVYCSDFATAEEAEERLIGSLEGDPITEPNHLRFLTGRRNDFWSKNVVAIGLSAGFLEPLESTSIHFIQEGITALLELFPDTRLSEIERQEYNERMALNFERVRDFLVLHYVATRREDTPLWRHFRSMALPDSLTEKLESWTHRGLVPSYEQSVFLPPSWIAVLVGQKIHPKAGDPRLANLPLSEIEAKANGIQTRIRSAVDRAPHHWDYLKSAGFHFHSDSLPAT